MGSKTVFFNPIENSFIYYLNILSFSPGFSFPRTISYTNNTDPESKLILEGPSVLVGSGPSVLE